MTSAVQLLSKQTANIGAGSLIIDYDGSGLSFGYPGGNVEDLFFLLDGTIGTAVVTITFGHRKNVGTNSTGNPKVYTNFYAPAAGAVTLSALGWSAKIQQKFTAMQIVVASVNGSTSLDLFAFA